MNFLRKKNKQYSLKHNKHPWIQKLEAQNLIGTLKYRQLVYIDIEANEQYWSRRSIFVLCNNNIA